jgi:hypothetical protein
MPGPLKRIAGAKAAYLPGEAQSGECGYERENEFGSRKASAHAQPIRARSMGIAAPASLIAVGEEAGTEPAREPEAHPWESPPAAVGRGSRRLPQDIRRWDRAASTAAKEPPSAATRAMSTPGRGTDFPAPQARPGRVCCASACCGRAWRDRPCRIRRRPSNSRRTWRRLAHSPLPARCPRRGPPARRIACFGATRWEA